MFGDNKGGYKQFIIFCIIYIIFQHICRNGRIDFKRQIAKTMDPIKDCLRKCLILIEFYFSSLDL